MSDEPVYTQHDLDAALRDQASRLSVESLRSELERMSRRIEASNHLKETLGEDIRHLSAQVAEVIGMVRDHQQVQHAPDALGDKLRAAGFISFTTEERALLPRVLRAAAERQVWEARGRILATRVAWLAAVASGIAIAWEAVHH